MDDQIKISCSNIWKLYGENPEKFLKENNNNPSTEQLKSNKYTSNNGFFLLNVGISNFT